MVSPLHVEPSISIRGVDLVKEKWSLAAGALAANHYNQGMNFVELAIPFFILAMAIELAYGAWKKNQTYRLNDASPA